MIVSAWSLLLGGALPVSQAAEVGSWRVVGLYDASALVAREAKGAPVDGGYVWRPAAGMTVSCGPTKTPDGLGVFEAEALAAGLSPSLAILLRDDGDGPGEPLRTDRVQVALAVGERKLTLQPAVLPRALQVSVAGDADLRDRRQVKTQIQTELCLEHKVGRGWIGGVTGEKALRQAFVLDPPPEGGADRRFFVGQRDPVPALMGPPRRVPGPWS